MTTIIGQVTGYEVNKIAVAGLLCVIMTPIAWIRDITKFSWTFMFGNLMLFVCFIVVTCFCGIKIHDQGGLGTGIVAMNNDHYPVMIGFAVYAFEGIGIVMPVM
jgi:proton-coupled amino acid transporter